VVPCKERVRFKNLTGDKLTFKANKTYVHCEVSQGAQTECIVWHRVEEVCCRQQAGEGSDGFVLLGPAFTKGGCLRGAVWKRHGRCLGRIRNVVPNLPRVLPEMTMVGALASMSVMPTKFFRNRFAQLSSGYMNFKAHIRRYVVDVYMGHKTTRLGSDDWNKFIADFTLRHGEFVLFYMTGRMPRAVVGGGGGEREGSNCMSNCSHETACLLTWLQLGLCFVKGGTDKKGGQLHVPH
uniref:TF-B3 domain-containing protein n=1 Tax=Aegilops tauschii subsp. strangulata TaxID=200361 RepID=A0A453IF79_AEGTS